MYPIIVHVLLFLLLLQKLLKCTFVSLYILYHL